MSKKSKIILALGLPFVGFALSSLLYSINELFFSDTASRSGTAHAALDTASWLIGIASFFALLVGVVLAIVIGLAKGPVNDRESPSPKVQKREPAKGGGTYSLKALEREQAWRIVKVVYIAVSSLFLIVVGASVEGEKRLYGPRIEPTFWDRAVPVLLIGVVLWVVYRYFLPRLYKYLSPRKDKKA
jgi:hypothetical protein